MRRVRSDRPEYRIDVVTQSRPLPSPAQVVMPIHAVNPLRVGTSPFGALPITMQQVTAGKVDAVMSDPFTRGARRLHADQDRIGSYRELLGAKATTTTK